MSARVFLVNGGTKIGTNSFIIGSGAVLLKDFTCRLRR